MMDALTGRRHKDDPANACRSPACLSTDGGRLASEENQAVRRVPVRLNRTAVPHAPRSAHAIGVRFTASHARKQTGGFRPTPDFMRDRVGLSAHAEQRADTLSGGQQQRVAIARALAQQPRLIVAAEPVSGLGPGSSPGIMELLRGIAQADGMAVVCSLHQVSFARDYADRIVGLSHGRVILDLVADGFDAGPMPVSTDRRRRSRGRRSAPDGRRTRRRRRGRPAAGRCSWSAPAGGN